MSEGSKDTRDMCDLLSIKFFNDIEHTRNDDISLQCHIIQCLKAFVEIGYNQEEHKHSDHGKTIFNLKWSIFWRFLADLSAKILESEKEESSSTLFLEIPCDHQKNEDKELLHLQLASLSPKVEKNDFISIGKHCLKDAAKVFVKDDNRLTPLHLAATVTNPNIANIRQLNNFFPRISRHKDKNGWLPLHFACKYSNSVDLVTELLQEYPEALSMKTSYGNTSLHLLCEHNRSTEALAILKRLLAANPSAASMTGRDGSIPLHTLIKSNALSSDVRVDMLHELLHAYPDGPAVRDSLGFTPVHFICENCCSRSEDMLEIMLQRCPEAARVTGSNGMLPLHNVRTNAMAKQLIDVYPDALSANIRGFGTPLHMAVYRSNVSLVQYLYSCRPESISEVNDSSSSPLLIAASLVPSYNLVKAVYDLDPSAINIRTNTGVTPLLGFLYATFTFVNFLDPISDGGKILRFLLKKGPDAVRLEDNSGNTPYSLCKAFTHRDWVRRLLLREAPDLDPMELKRLNYEERRMAMFLFFLAVRYDGKQTLFGKIRKASHNHNLMHRVVEFL